jgi:cell division protein FtsQ
MSAGRWNGPLMGLLLLAAAAIAVGANVWKKELRVTHVTTRGNAIVTRSEILALAEIPPEAKLFGVDLFAVRQRVERNTFVRFAAVNREAPDGIAITVEERRPIAALVLDRMLMIDQDGFVLPAAHSDDTGDLPVLTGDLSAAECAPGKTVTAPAVREAIEILTIAAQAGEDVAHLISEIHLDGERDIILYTTEGGVPVVFGHGDTAAKIVKLQAFWKDIVAQRGPAELGSVDLRFADQIVARWRNDAGAPQ